MAKGIGLLDKKSHFLYMKHVIQVRAFESNAPLNMYIPYTFGLSHT